MPTCSGLLTKRGTSIKTWHKRHFSLEGVNLIYYTSDGSEKKGEYVINSDTTVEEAHLKRNCFCLIQHGRTLYMAADSLPEKEMWMSCLYDAIEEARIIEISKRASFKKRELTRDLADMNDEGMGLERISEITDDTSFAMPSRGPVRAKSTRDMVEAVPKNKNPIFASFESKKIHFHIMNARNLFSKGTSDTFARITVGNDTQETVVIKRDLNPSWDETFSFEWHYSLRYAKIEVWDVGSYGMGERFLGVVYVPIIPISSMSQVGKWYKLGKRSSKSHVSGEVYIDAYCDECYDFYPQQILNTVQDLQDLRGHVSDPGVIVPQTDDTPMEEIEAGEKRLMGKFMMQFPPLETEHLEDICLSVTLKPTLERGNGNSPLFCDGILLLTNYRLIFVSNSRLMFNQNDFFTLDTDLTTAIPLTTVVACNACSDQDPHDVSAKVSHDGIAIITNDARAFTFLFYEDVEKDSDGNVRTNRHASADTLFTKSGEEKKTATLSNVSNSYRYLDANESAEGCPSKRFLATLERKGFNRLCELHSNINIHHALISTLQYDPNSELKDEYDDPELDSGMLNWLKSLPRDLRDSYRSSFNDGWHIYDAKEEFKRMGLPDAQWRISTANSSFEICDTYPTLLAVPVAVNDAKLGLAARFRSRGRLPVLSWRHPQNFCALTRSSQPLVGMQKRQSTEDEALLTAINQAAQMSGEGVRGGLQTWTNIKGKISSPFVIFDARPKLNATANQAAGKGYEMSFAYKNCNVLFMNIDNIHVMRKSLDALEDHCRTPVSEDPNWYSQVEGSGWLVHCNRVLVAAARLVHCMCKEQLSVLVHCSDGWDRTAQLTSLSMLMMDPFYRTYIGFQILIEKEWVSFGHKFGDRLGWSDAGWNSQERSPVFMQFLDCVHQMIHQNPNIFEFNEDLLVFIMRQTQSAWFGNFLLNSDKDRKMLRLSDRTVSLWSYVLMNFGTFGNPHYKPSKSDVWVPVTSIRKTVLWEKWFLKWHDVVWRNEWNGKNEDFSEIHVAETPTDITAHSHVKQCYECDTNFSIFLRRDHCFNCGNVFCEKCLVSKPDVHGTAHLYCRNCFDVYQEAIDAQLSGISQNVLMSSRMTRRVLGSASNIPLASRKSVEPAQPEHHENGNVRRNIVEELQQDVLKPISKREWMKLDDNERNSYVEEEDTAQYVDVRLKSRVNQVPVEKKPSLLSNLTSMFSSSTPKSQATEDAWASGTCSSPVTSAYKISETSPPPSSPNPPKRFIPFSNEMMTKSSTTLLSEERDSDPPPLAKKYSSKTNQVQSPAKDQVRRSNTGDVGKVEAGGDRDRMRHENSHSTSRSSPKRQSSMPDERSNGKRSPSRSPARRMHSTGSDRSSRSPSHSPHQSPRRVISTGSDRSNRSPTRSVSTQGSSDNLFDRGPKRKNSRESLMNGDVAPPPSDKQISILPPEDEAAKLLKKKSSSNRFDMYKKTSVDLSKSKNSMQTRKNSMEDSF